MAASIDFEKDTILLEAGKRKHISNSTSIWAYFGFLKKHGDIDAEIKKDFVFCNLCFKKKLARSVKTFKLIMIFIKLILFIKFAVKSGTGNMYKHVKTNHEDITLNTGDTITSVKEVSVKQMSLDRFWKNSIDSTVGSENLMIAEPTTKSDNRLIKSFLKWCILDLLSPRIKNTEPFTQFLIDNKILKKTNVFGEKEIIDLLQKTCQAVRNKIIEALKEVTRVFLFINGFDYLPNRERIYFCSLSFIDADWLPQLFYLSAYKTTIGTADSVLYEWINTVKSDFDLLSMEIVCIMNNPPNELKRRNVTLQPCLELSLAECIESEIDETITTVIDKCLEMAHQTYLNRANVSKELENDTAGQFFNDVCEIGILIIKLLK